MLREGLLEGVIPGGGGVAHPWGGFLIGGFLSGGYNSFCKSPVVRMSLMYLNNDMGVDVAAWN